MDEAGPDDTTPTALGRQIAERGGEQHLIELLAEVVTEVRRKRG